MLHRFRIFLAAVCALTVFAAMTPPARAEAFWPPIPQEEAIGLLQFYEIVRGDPDAGLLLEERLTRAQAAAIFVRAMNREGLARMLAGAVPFTDAKDHWAAGEIAMAERLGLMKGYGDGRFGPDREITYAEVLTVLLRMLGREPSGPWSPDRIMAAAAELNLVPPELPGTVPAVRGQVFWSLAIAVSQVELDSGETVLREYLDREPPTLTLDQPVIETDRPTVVVEGTAQGAYRVMVGDQEAELSPADGRFAAEIQLEPGEHEILVEASDPAGNRVTETLTAAYWPPPVRIRIEGPASLRVGGQARLNVTMEDRYGNPTRATELDYQLSGNVATFDPETFTLQAGAEKGRGVLTIWSGAVRGSYSFEVNAPSDRVAKIVISEINGGRPLGIGKEVTVLVRMLDESGRPVTDDYWRSVTLSADGLSGVSISPRTAVTEAGVATFTIRGTRESSGTLKATSSGLPEVIVPVSFLTSPRVVLNATAQGLKPDGSSSTFISAFLEDETGRRVVNSSGSDIAIVLAVSGTDGSLERTTLVIPSGRYNSSPVRFQAGYRRGTATITGVIESDHEYSVQGLSIPIEADLQGVRLQVSGPDEPQVPGETVPITVEVVNDQGRLINTGSYAFQLVVETSNGEPVTGGLPEGVELTFTGSQYRPVVPSGASAGSQDAAYIVVGRTSRGTARLELRYDKSGTVTITPVAVEASSWAYHDAEGFGPATGSTGMLTEPGQIVFAGTPSAVQLTVDSAIGTDLPGGAARQGQSVTVRARMLDEQGLPIPSYNGTIVLTRASGTGATRIAGAQPETAAAVAENGVAEFVIQAGVAAGYDVYTASAGGMTSNPVTVAVRDAPAAPPVITAVRGVREGNPSPVNGYVGPDDEYMEIQLEPQAPPNPGETDYYVLASVYRKGAIRPFFTQVVNLSGFDPMIRVPKGRLPVGTYSYEVTVDNGFGPSDRSLDSPTALALNAIYNEAYTITSGRYDAATGTLNLYTQGLPTDGTVDPARLRLIRDGVQLPLTDPSVTAQVVSPNLVTVQLGALADQVDPDVFHGKVTVEAENGWYITADEVYIAPGVAAPVRPMAVITHGALDMTARRLYLYGVGFRPGSLSLDLIEVQDGTDAVALDPRSDKVFAVYDNQVTITLSQATLDAIRALSGQSVHVTARTGWLRLGNASVGAVEGTSRKLYWQTYIRRAAYDAEGNTLTLYGTGFTGSSVDPTLLRFTDADAAVPEWRPGSPAQVTVVSDEVIEIRLDDADADAFESQFGGLRVYLNSDPGWLTTGDGWTAASLPVNHVTFMVSGP